jgi:hypothetical protein
MLTQKTLDPAAVGAMRFAPPTDNTAIARLISRMVAYSPDDRPTVSELVYSVEQLMANLNATGTLSTKPKQQQYCTSSTA